MTRNLIKVVCALSLALILFASAKPVKKDLAKDLAKHVVPFKLAIKGGDRFATGFYLNYREKNYIVTNRHVCDAHKRIYKHDNIQFGDYVGKIIAIDPTHDLCLVTSNRKEGLSLAKNQSKPLDKVTVIGFPRGLGKTIREGRVVGDYPIFAPWLSDFSEAKTLRDYVKALKIVETIQISAIAYGGNSGSPILNEEGNVTGVLFAGHRLYHTETYIVPLSYLKSFLRLNAR